MFKGIGIDAVEIKNFDKFRMKKEHPFIKKVFTEGEIKYCFEYKNPSSHLAGTFAAKEAVAKALGARSNSFLNIEVRRNIDGLPEIWQKNKKIKSILISITHTDLMALAIAIKIK